MAIDLKPVEECDFDLLSLGECMIRLSPPGHQRIELSPSFEAWCGGGEYNVAYALARLGLKTGWASKLVDNPLGHFIRNHAMTSGMDISEVVWVPFDGTGKKDRIGLDFVEVGTGIRPSVTVYDRGHSAISHMEFEDLDWNRIFCARKVRWFHTGGIFTALSQSCAETVTEVVKLAKKAGTIVSYDLNFRSKLWDSETAQKETRELMPYIDVLFGNEEDFQKSLGAAVKGVDDNLKNLPVENYKLMVKELVSEYPNLKIVAATLREVITANINNWSAILYYDNKFYESKKYENFEIEDRVGGGDGFCSGMIFGIFNNYTPQEWVDLGAAHGALLQTTRGDTSMFTKSELMHVFEGGSARIKR